MRRCPGVRDVVMIGDRVQDVIGAQDHAMDSIAVAYGYGSLAELRKAQPTYLANTLDEIGQFVG